MKISGQWSAVRDRWKTWAVVKSQLLVATLRRWCSNPHLRAVGWDFYEIGISVFPFILGAQMVVAAATKRWEWLYFNAVVSVVLAIASFMLHRIRRQRIDLEVTIRKRFQLDNLRLIEENQKLKNVALSALAVKLSIDHGFKPNLEPLTRYLDVLAPEEKLES